MNPFLEPVIITIAERATEALLNRGGGIVSLVLKYLFKRRVLGRFVAASKEYLNKYSERRGTIKILWMPDPVSIEGIYVDTEIYEDSLYKFSTIDLIGESSDRKRISAIKVANKKKNLVLLGNPGTGKTTFLKKVGMEALKGNQGNYRHTCIPVFLELKRIRHREKISLKGMIVSMISDEFDICGLPDGERFVETLLASGKLLILLDGLDEVPSNRLDLVVTEIDDFVYKYDKNRFIVSCRKAAYTSKLKAFSDIRISTLTEKQIERFINKWFSLKDQDMNVPQTFVRILNSEDNAHIKELAKTPLLLTFLCLVYEDNLNLPKNKSEIYKKALSIILEKWAAEKRIFHEERPIDIIREKMLLSEIACKGFVREKYSFSRQEIEDSIVSFLDRKLQEKKEKNEDGISSLIFHAMKVEQGIFVEIETKDSVYAFSHIALQEYLTAAFICGNEKYIEKLIEDFILNERWSYVFTLVAGLSEARINDFLSKLSSKTRKFISTERVNFLLLNICKATSFWTAADYKISVKRAACAISIISEIVLYILNDISKRIELVTEKIKTSCEDIRAFNASASRIVNIGGVTGLANLHDRSLSLRNCLQEALDSLVYIKENIQNYSGIIEKWWEIIGLSAKLIEVSHDNKPNVFYFKLDVAHSLVMHDERQSENFENIFDSSSFLESEVSEWLKISDDLASRKYLESYYFSYSKLLDKIENRKQEFTLLKDLIRRLIDSEEFRIRRITQSKLMMEVGFNRILSKQIPNLYQISLDEIAYLEKYLSSIILLLKCKNSSELVDREPWEYIEEKILAPRQTVS